MLSYIKRLLSVMLIVSMLVTNIEIQSFAESFDFEVKNTNHSIENKSDNVEENVISVENIKNIENDLEDKSILVDVEINNDDGDNLINKNDISIHEENEDFIENDINDISDVLTINDEESSTTIEIKNVLNSSSESDEENDYKITNVENSIDKISDVDITTDSNTCNVDIDIITDDNIIYDFATNSNIEEKSIDFQIATESSVEIDILVATDSEIDAYLENNNTLFGANPNPNMNYGTLIDLAEADRLDLDYNWFNKFFGTGYSKDDIKKIEFKAGVDINGRGWNLLEEVNDTTYGTGYKLLSKWNVKNAGNSVQETWSMYGGANDNVFPYPEYNEGTYHHDGAYPYKYLRDQFYPSFPQYYKDNMIPMTVIEEGWGRGGYPHTLRTFTSYIRIPLGTEVEEFVGQTWDDLDVMREKLKNGSDWYVLEHVHNDYLFRNEGISVFPADGNYDPRHGVGDGGHNFNSYTKYNFSHGIRAVMTMTKEGLKPEPGTAGEPIYTYEIYNTDDTSAANRKLIGLAFLYTDTTGGYDVEIHMLYGNAFNFAEDNAQALFVDFNNCKEISGLDLLDFSETTNMSSMFEGCTVLDTITFVDENLTKLQDTFGANATNLDSMFKDCAELTNVDFLPDNFASGATTMVSTFENTKISACPTNINTSNVTDMTRTFAKLQSITFDFDSIDLSACTDVTEMLADSDLLTTITVNNNYLGLPNNVTTKTDMFHNCPNLLGGGGFRYKDQFASGDFARVDYGGIIPGYFTCNDLTIYNNLDICIDNTWRTNFEASGVLTGARKIIFTQEALPGGDADDIDMPIKLNGVDITGKAFLMHSDGSLIIQFVPQIHNLSTTDTWNGFFKDFVNVTNIEGLDLIDTTPITKLEQTFNNCRNLATISIAEFKTINITTIESAFEGCEKFTGFVGDIPEFSSLVNAQYAFKGCSSLKTIDIDPFFTSGLLYIKEMFRYCSSLTNIYTDNRTVNCSLSIDVYNSENMFDGCTSLTGGQGTVYINEYPKNINMANTDFGGIKPGYFTLTNTNLYNNVTFTVPNTWYNLANYLRTKTNVKEVQFIEGSPSPGDFTVMYDMAGSYDKVKLYIKTDSDGKYIAKIYTGCSLIHKTKLSTTLADFFSGFTSLTQVSGWDKVDMTSVTNMKGMFKDCSSLTSLDLTLFDTREITNMSEMFRGCTNLATITVTSNFVTTKVTSSDNMFTDCIALTGDHGTTYTNKYASDTVTAVNKTHAWMDGRHGQDGYFSGVATGYNVSGIAINTTPLTTYYIGDFFFPNGLVLNVTWDDNETTQIPYNTTTANRFTFNPPITQQLTPTDTTETVTYSGYTASFTLTIQPTIAYTLTKDWFNGSGINKNTVKSISFFIFPTATPAIVTNEWDIPESNGLKGYVINDGTENDVVVYAPHAGTIIGAQDCSYLFSDISQANSFRNLTKFNNLSYLVTSRMTNMSSMFSNCAKLETLDLGSFNTFNVTDMTKMFYGCEELVSVNTSSFNTKKVTTMYGMFQYCKKLKQVNVNNFDTSSVRDFGCAFYDCEALESLDVSKFNTSSARDVQSMFYNCSNLTSLNLSGFNMWLVTNAEQMFKGCNKLTSIGNVVLSTNDITSCKSMFEGCAELTNINISKFNTSNIGSDGFESMFKGCTKLKSITLGDNFVLGGATTLANMFDGCESLTSLNLSAFASNNVNNVTAMFKNNRSLKTIVASNSFAVKNKTGNDMFEGCDALEGGAGTTYTNANISDSSYAQVDEGNSNPGYFTWGGTVVITYLSDKDTNIDSYQQVVNRNETTTLLHNNFKRYGYQFLYWMDDSNIIYVDTITPYNSLILYACWQKIVIYSGGGGGGGGGGAGPFSDLIKINTLFLDGVLTIKGNLFGTNSNWVYDQVNNKWKLKYVDQTNQEYFANDGFYIMNTIVKRVLGSNYIDELVSSIYYFDKNGYMYTGYIETKADGKRYLFDFTLNSNEGQLVKGWKFINGDWYYFGADGSMLKNTITPDGYQVGMDGKWIK